MRAIEEPFSLDELCLALNTDAASRADYMAGLPKFSRIAPPDVAGIWSWDATRVLLADSKGIFYIEPRDPEAWYPNEKDSPLK